MADLNEVVVTVTRKKWDRSNKIRIDNEYGKTPTITFEVQTAITDDEILVGTTPKSMFVVNFDPTESYPLLNPVNDSVLSPDAGNHFMLQAHVNTL